ncbi:hypothetical protein SDC9_199308 [bioreactor metagenome]|uniref:Uncharacterized protein n=1 Tax=bioreactor metagenome TaxID=1076179 RepID=A0A645IMF9_9ZZZZ
MGGHHQVDSELPGANAQFRILEVQEEALIEPVQGAPGGRAGGEATAGQYLAGTQTGGVRWRRGDLVRRTVSGKAGLRVDHTPGEPDVVGAVGVANLWTHQDSAAGRDLGQRAHRAGRDNRVVVQDRDAACARSQCPLDAAVHAAGEAQVGLQLQDFDGWPALRDRLQHPIM